MYTTSYSKMYRQRAVNICQILSGVLNTSFNETISCKQLTPLLKKSSVNSTINYKYLLSNQLLNIQTARCYSTETPETPKQKFPPLMDFNEIMWPSLFKSVRNWLLANFIIIPYFDKEFSVYDFVIGSKKAVEVVSQKLSSGNLNDLEGLVTKNALNTLRSSINNYSLAQCQQLAVIEDDVYFSFPYQIGVIFDETTPVQRRFVEITMVFHVLKGLAAMRAQGQDPPLNAGVLPEYREHFFILNYRFIREFTKGVEDQWIINIANHFRPIDIQ